MVGDARVRSRKARLAPQGTGRDVSTGSNAESSCRSARSQGSPGKPAPALRVLKTNVPIRPLNAPVRTAPSSAPTTT